MKIQITIKKVVLLYVNWNFHVLKNLNLISKIFSLLSRQAKYVLKN